MRIMRSPEKMRQIVSELKKSGKTIGLVPTMGALHDGHLSLVKIARAQNNVTIVSIFVNPAQFGPKEDYLRYPRPLAKDSVLCRGAGVDYIFAPEVKQMYPEGYRTYVQVDGLSDILCGKSRPGHFRGVATVVAKLLNITAPDRAYFGQKDYQQVRVIEKMANDLNIPVKIVQCPIVREQSGLAMSSRNSYLSREERLASAEIYKALQHAAYLVECGKLKNSGKITEKVKEIISIIPGVKIDYIDIRNPKTLEKVEISDAPPAEAGGFLNGRVLPGRMQAHSSADLSRRIPCRGIEKPIVVLCAVWVGKTRLIDNIIVK